MVTVAELPKMGLTASQYEMYLKMLILRGEKNEGYKIHLLERWFPIRRLTCPAIIGTFALTSIPTKQRWMLRSQVYEFEGITCTPTDLARDYLSIKYPRKRRSRITTKQYRNFFDHRRNAPVYAQPQTLESACYVDIKSAYWSILECVGWDVDYMPSGWLKVKSSVSDFPFPGIKMARNCLVSVAANATGSMRLWTGKELVIKKTGNVYCNMMLWSLVMDVLNGIATECINAGAIYAYTDGFICDHSIAANLLNIISSWGLTGTIKHEGRATVKGSGSYRIGERETKKFRLQKERAYDKVDRTVDIPFLKARLKWFANRIRL